MARNPRTYIVLSRAWYADANRIPNQTDSINILGQNWEFHIDWHDFPSLVEQASEITIFCDAMAHLDEFVDVIDEFGKLCERYDYPTVGDVEKMLKKLKIKDVTPTIMPRKHRG